MAIDLVNPGDGWFNRAGSFGGAFNYTAALYGSANDTVFQQMWSLFATSEQAAVQTLPADLSSWRTTPQTYTGVFSAGAQTASQIQVNRDFPLVPYTFPESVNRVRAQMVATSQSVNRPTLTDSVTPDAGNMGDTKIFVSTTNIYGDPLDTTLGETLIATCTSQGSGFGASFSVIGEPVVPTYSRQWPGGSGSSTSLGTVDPANNGIVTNSELSAFAVANTPDSWTIINGSAGTTVLSATAGGVRGADCVVLKSDGSLTTKLGQGVSLSTNTVYAVTFQVKINANSVSGTLVAQLWDPDAGAVLQNDAGANLQVSYNLNGGAGEVTTSYQLLTVFFSTPRQLPTTVQIRIGYGVAGVNTRELSLCNVQVYAATPLYGPGGTGTAGPFAVSVGNTTFSAVDDSYTLVFTNSLGTDSFVWSLQRLHDFRSLGLYLPSSVSPTIPDNLVLH